jgi:hypothetical protein
MSNKPQLSIVQQQKQSEFVCSACGAGRDCDCNAPALKRLAAQREANKEAVRRHRAKAKEELCNITQHAPVEGSVQYEADKAECQRLYGNVQKAEQDAEASAEARKELYAASTEFHANPKNIPEKVAQANLRSIFMLNSAMAIRVAKYQGPIDEEVQAMCRRVCDAWNKLAVKLERDHG